MALTKVQIREILSEAGLTGDMLTGAVDKIADGHFTSINALREQRDAYKADAEKLPTVQKELDDLKAKDGGEDWKLKYENEHSAFENYKNNIESENKKNNKKSLYRQLLLDNKVDEKRIDAILKVTDFEGINIGEDGKLANVDALNEGIKTEWSGFIKVEKDVEPKPDTPPAGGGGKSEPKSEAARLEEEYHKNLYGEK